MCGPRHRVGYRRRRHSRGFRTEWSHRACLGLAGSPGHEGDLDLFRRAVALETAVAGKMAHRTGIQVLHRHLVEVVGARTLALPAEDAAALDALSPGA